MPLRKRSFDLEGGQRVTAVVALPEAAPPWDTAVILGHGAGSDMTNPLLSAVHEGLASHGHPTVKFNFPYKERGGRAPDPAPVLEGCWRRVIDAVRNDHEIGTRHLVIGGKSMGGRMASHVAAQGADVAGLVFLGYPLHPPGKPDKLRIVHLDQIKAPMLFFAGTRDPLCNLDLLKTTIDKLKAPITLHVIEGGDHSFKVLKSMKRSETNISDEIIGTAAAWLKETLNDTSNVK